MQHAGKLDRITHPLHVHVHRKGLAPQQMVVQRGDGDPAGEQLRHDRIDLVHGQHEIAHHHPVGAGLLECEPAAKRQTGLNLDTVERDLKVGTRQRDPIDAAGQFGAGLAEGFPDARPVALAAFAAVARPATSITAAIFTILDIFAFLFSEDCKYGDLPGALRPAPFLSIRGIPDCH